MNSWAQAASKTQAKYQRSKPMVTAKTKLRCRLFTSCNGGEA